MVGSTAASRPGYAARSTPTRIYSSRRRSRNSLGRSSTGPPLRLHGSLQIILFSGLLRAMMCYVEIIVFMNLLQARRPSATMAYDGRDNPEAAAFSLAAFSILDNFLVRGVPPIAFGDMLGPRALTKVKLGFAVAAVFVLAHDGHLHPGHDLRTPGLSARASASLVLEEEIDDYQRQEFDANAFAYKTIKAWTD